MKTTCLRLFVSLLVCLVIAVNTATAQKYWVGGSGNNWTTGANWLGGAAPANPYVGTVYFNNSGVGTSNVMDQSWTVSALDYTNQAPDTSAPYAHTTYLNGNTLAVTNGVLSAGRALGVSGTLTNTVVSITEGTVQLGCSASSADLIAAYKDLYYGDVSGTVFTINGTINATNLANLYCGYHAYLYYGGRIWDGLLDLSGAMINSRGTANALKMTGDLFVGHSPGLQARGILKLPPALTEISCRDLAVDTAPGWDGGSTLDLGAGSQLAKLTVTNRLWIGGSGPGGIAGFPTNVAVSVGLPNAPGSIRIAFGTQYRTGQFPTNILALTNGSLSGYVGDVQVGVSASYNYGYGMGGILDLATASVNLGGTNKFKAGLLKIGGTWDYWGVYPYPSYSVSGTLNLPPTVTEIVCGPLQIGAVYGGRGVLELGANAQLQAFTVTNTFYLSYDGGLGAIAGLPTGVVFTVGQPNAPVPMYIASAYDQRPYVFAGIPTILALTNGSFAAYLSRLEIGSGRYSNIHDWYVDGALDLRQSTLAAFNVNGDVWLGSAPLATNNTALSAKQCKGRLRLPAGTMNISSNLYVGDTNGAAYSLGLLELNGTIVKVDRQVRIDTSGFLTNHLLGTSCGLDVTSTQTNDFTIATGGKVHLSFDVNPIDAGNAYYGLRMNGNQLTYFQDLATAGRITWTTNALPAHLVKRFGIFYDTKSDRTYVGIGQLTAPGLLIQAL